MTNNQQKPFANAKIMFVIALTLLFTFFYFLVKEMNKTHDAREKIEERPLRIGDSVPDIKFTVVNCPANDILISEFDGKMILLGFWSTWCICCIEKFPQLDSLQRVFNDQLQIILVNSMQTGDRMDNVISFFEKNNVIATGTQVLVAVEDYKAFGCFPYHSLPHYIWIGADRKVKGITSAEEVTAENILEMLNAL